MYFRNGIHSLIGGFCIIAAAIIAYMEQKEIYAMSKIKKALREECCSPDDIEEMTKSAISMLKEGTTDWTDFDEIKLSKVVQEISSAQKKSR